jgi:ribosomal protein S18 acetylase RimI-like enzyme
MNLTRKEIKELVVLDALCFDPPINYTFRDMKLYTRHPEAVLLREYDGERLIAFCLGHADNGNIITIDVHPDHRRHGLGGKLLKTILKEFRSRGVPFAVSQIALDNLSSLTLHKNLGFEIRHILYGYYPDGSAAYQLVLPLSPDKD